jgi:hypothetical protein
MCDRYLVGERAEWAPDKPDEEELGARKIMAVAFC